MSSVQINKSQLSVFKEVCQTYYPWREAVMGSREKLAKEGYGEESFWDNAILGPAVYDKQDELKRYLPAGKDDSGSEEDGQTKEKTPTLSQILDE